MELASSVWLVLWTAILASTVYCVYHVIAFFVDVRKRGQVIDKFPSEPRHWLLGHLHLFPGPDEAGIKYFRELSTKFPRAQSVWMGNFFRPTLTVYHPDTAKAILKTSEPKLKGLGGTYDYIKRWQGDGLLASSGHKWARNRRLLTPAFHFDVLKPYITIKNRAVEILLDKIDPHATSGESFEVFSNVSLMTFDIILRCTMSYENDVQRKGESHPYVQAVAELGDLWFKRIVSPWLHFEWLYRLTKDGRTFKRHCDYVHSISDQVIQNRKRVLAEHGDAKLKNERYLDLLDILLTARDDDGVGLSDQEIRDEVDTFMFAGHGTAASSISWTLYSLAEHPEYQALCQQEIDSILDGRTDESITWNDLSELKYLTMCIKESLRLHTPVPIIQRETQNEVTIDDITLPPRTMITIQLYALHHNPTVWENSLEFRPSRFSPENISKMDSFAFVPFSAGPRNCIGQHFAMQEQKVVLARILRRYDVSLDPNFKVQKKMSVVMTTENGMYLKFLPRSVH